MRWPFAMLSASAAGATATPYTLASGEPTTGIFLSAFLMLEKKPMVVSLQSVVFDVHCLLPLFAALRVGAREARQLSLIDLLGALGVFLRPEQRVGRHDAVVNREGERCLGAEQAVDVADVVAALLFEQLVIRDRSFDARVGARFGKRQARQELREPSRLLTR